MEDGPDEKNLLFLGCKGNCFALGLCAWIIGFSLFYWQCFQMKTQSLKILVEGNRPALVSLLAQRIFGICCIFPENLECSWAEGSVSLAAAVPVPRVLSLQRPPRCSGPDRDSRTAAPCGWAFPTLSSLTFWRVFCHVSWHQPPSTLVITQCFSPLNKCLRKNILPKV